MGLLGEGDELLACGYRKYAQVLVLRVVFELDMALPEGKVRPAGRKFKLYNVGDRELQEEIGRFRLMNAHATSMPVCVSAGAYR